MKANHVFWLIVLVLAIIIVVPWLFTQTYFSLGNHSTTGEIGDTIGGLIARFINGLAAILVFVTFREQVKANKALQLQNSSLEQQISEERLGVNYERILNGLATIQKYEFRVGVNLVDFDTVVTSIEHREGALMHPTETDKDVETGRNDDKPQLLKASAHAKKIGGTLLIAKLDWLSRNVSFIFTLRDTRVNFKALDLDDMNTLNLGIFATIAQYERERTSDRLRDAFSAKRRQGERMGFCPT